MARFIPEDMAPDIYESERVTYDALKTLPNGYVIMHSYPWLRPDRSLESAALREGEADFLVLHPDKGLLVVEVKGGEPRLGLDGRTWWRGNQKMKNPFLQARKNMYALLEAVEERTQGVVRREQFTYGYLAVFPHHRYEGQLPHDGHQALLLDARHMSAFADCIEKAFSSFRDPPRGLGGQRFGALLDALLPKMRLLRCVGAEIESERARIVQLTEHQQQIVSGLRNAKRVLVEGTAGSGKTLIALDFAMECASQGQRTLFICFNRSLGEWLEERAEGDPRWGAAKGLITIRNFHRFVRQLADRAKVDVHWEDEQAARPYEFWNAEVPCVLMQAEEVLRAEGRWTPFDAIVVDEAQDFYPDWWDALQMLLANSGGRFYAFQDRHQALRSGTGIPAGVTFDISFPLTTNCRNTHAIARTSAALIDMAEAHVMVGSLEGEMPQVTRVKTPHEVAGLVRDAVRRFREQGVIPSQIALIGPAGKDASVLKDVLEFDGIKLVKEPSSWRRGHGILVTTAKSFKGLEADVVVLYSLSGLSDVFSKADLYVACTRARHRLVLVCQPGEVRTAVEVALAKAEGARG